MPRKLKWQIPGEPLAARYNWCQGPVPGRGPAVEKHWPKGSSCKLPICISRFWPKPKSREDFSWNPPVWNFIMTRSVSLWLLQMYGRMDGQAVRGDANAPKKRTCVYMSRPWSKWRWPWRNNPRLCSQQYKSSNLDRLPYMGKEDMSLHGPRKDSDNRHTVSVRASGVYGSL
jgi:hypothetical protein